MGESKDWIADPKNRICDAPGSWLRGPVPAGIGEAHCPEKEFRPVGRLQQGRRLQERLLEANREGEIWGTGRDVSSRDRFSTSAMWCFSKHISDEALTSFVLIVGFR